MKNFALTLFMLIISGLAQANVLATSASPFILATRLAETGVAVITAGTQTVLGPFLTTRASIEARGVAGVEQLKDELVLFDQDLQRRLVHDIDDVRQEGLRELFAEIASDAEEMERVRELVPQESDVLRIATVVVLKLFH